MWFLWRFVTHTKPNFGVLDCSSLSLQCCVFPAAVVLLNSWHVLLRNLWDEHLNHSLILDLKQTLDKIIKQNINTEVRVFLYLPIIPYYMSCFTLFESLRLKDNVKKARTVSAI